ncbi:glycosyltransferase involved in cell wall biosynthesis [Micromonospora profundi]|uniref:glycosyltransferase n=1 Tax=Micromonospora profundi TaxID=1420889 RepID=UPI001439CA19|nr:glycosyltransferase [Micromonospora profundi]NJC13552.1 glycosyltransferase involved in cell wall biosynthesis [Micromonospora profundi]
MKVTIEATPIRPAHAAGVEAFTYGLLDGLVTATSHDLHVNVLRGTLDAWRERVPHNRLSWTEVGMPLRSDNRYGRILRGWTPDRVRESVALRRTVNALRQRARPARDDSDVVLFPFHCAPARARSSVVVVHDLRHLHAAFSSPGFGEVVRENVAHASAVVVSWPHPYREVLTLFPEAADRVALIPPPTFQPAPDRLLSDPEPGLLLYPSSTATHKNHATLLEAMALLPECRLVCPGPLVEPEATRLLARAARPDLRGRVTFPGFVTLDELNKLYARAEAVVVPSLWEAASGAILEAFSWGLPVACADVDPLRAQLEFTGADAAVFSAKDPVALADAIRRLRANREHYATASRRANSRLAGRTWADTASDYAAVLEWVAAGRPGPIPRSPFAAALANGETR